MLHHGRRAALANSAAPPDAQFNYVTMLLHGNGTNGAQNNTFLDSSSNAFTITRNGNTTQGSFSPYGSNWSVAFATADAVLSVPSGTNLRFGTSSMCVELWMYATDTPAGSQGLLVGDWTTGASPGPSNWGIDYRGTTVVATCVNAGNAYSDQGSTTLTGSVAQGSWNHLALTYDGTTLRLFVNGALAQSSAYSGFSTNASSYSSNITIGDYSNFSGYYYVGFISNLRIVKGSSVYTSAFTPSTTPLTAITNTQLLTCQSNRFIDNSANALTVTATNSPSVERFNPFGTSTAYSTSTIGGSGYFDGSGDKLTTPSSTAWNFGTGDFTIEMWAYANATIPTYSNAFFLLDARTSANWYVFLASNALYFGDSGGSEFAGGTVRPFSWNHLVISRVSGTTRGFVNGVQAFSFTDGGNYAGSPVVTVGGRYTLTTYDLNGYMSDVRIVKGSGVTSVTVPTAPLTAITNTQLLLSMTNGAIYDNAMMNDLETAGNAQISTSVKKYGTGSLYTAASGDYFAFANKPSAYISGIENFTVECWIYPTTSTTYHCIYSSGYPFQVYFKSGTIELYLATGNSGSYNIANGTTGPASSVSLNTWSHIAIVRNGTSITVYVNGVAGTPATSGLAIAVPTAANSALAAYSVTPSAYLYAGYIDDFRITKGYARYTANFTPPTSALVDKGPN